MQTPQGGPVQLWGHWPLLAPLRTTTARRSARLDVNTVVARCLTLVVCVLTMFRLWVIDSGGSNLWIYFQLYRTESNHVSQLRIVSRPAELACLRVVLLVWDAAAVWWWDSTCTNRKARTTLHWCCLKGTWTGSGAQRPPGPYDDLCFSRGIKANVVQNLANMLVFF